MALRVFLTGLALYNITSAFSTSRETSQDAVASIDPTGIYIRAAHLQDGSLIVGYAAPVGHNDTMQSARSTDGATSWTKMGTMDSGVNTTYDLGNANVLQLSSGRILYAYRNHEKTTDPNNSKNVKYTQYRITMDYSDDGGKSWHYLSQVTERPAAGYNGLWEPFVRLAADGTLQVYYSEENNQTDQDSHMMHSPDNGTTWIGPVHVSGESVHARDGMTGVAKLNDKGSLMWVSLPRNA